MNNKTGTSAAPIVGFKADLRSLRERGELALPSSVSFAAFQNALVVTMTDNPSILQYDRAKVFKAVRTLAAAGLVPDGREAALVAFKGEVQAMPMVAGLIKVARNSGKISSLWADVVYEGEILKTWVENGDRKWDHVREDDGRIDAMSRGGKVRGAYAVAKLADGTVEFQPMSFDEIEKRRMASGNQRGPSPTGIWEKWYDEMAKKTVIRNLCKRLPMSAEDMERIMQEQEPLLSRDVTQEPEAPRRNLAQQLTDKFETIEGEVVPEPDTSSFEYDEGRNSWGNGDPLNSCSYEAGSQEAVDWLAGWTDADAEGVEA